MLDDLRPLWHAEGLDDPSWPDIYGQLYLHPFPPSFGQRPDSPMVRPLGPARATPSEDPPDWLDALGAHRRCVYVTAGTERRIDHLPVARVFEALRDLDVDAVATIGPHVQPAALGTVPSNVRVERFVPQAELLGRVAAVISHGGAGTVLGAASHGRPQLVVPLFADQWENGSPSATPVAACSSALTDGRRGCRRMLRTLLDSTSHRDAAARVADEIAAMPTPSDLVPEIEALADV